MHVVLQTHEAIAFSSCPMCSSVRSQGPECMPPPNGRCEALDTSQNSVFEVRSSLTCLVKHQLFNVHVSTVTQNNQTSCAQCDELIIKFSALQSHLL